MSTRPKKPARPASRARPLLVKGWLWLGVAALVLVVACFVFLLAKPPHFNQAASGISGSGPSAPIVEDERRVFAQYAGSESCRSCHAEAYESWAISNHGLAERRVEPQLDQAAFVPASSFRHATQSTSSRFDGTNYLITCVGLSRTNETHRVVRVIGNDPLRQYLAAFPGGRLQTLEAAFDPRKNEWFNVYGEEDRLPGDWGHWTGRGMNWNSMCASCHNTRLRKNYRPASDSYATTMAEMSVGCEACHGPLKAHVDWQHQHGQEGRRDPTPPKPSRRQVMDACGFCHARRSELTGDFKPGDSFFDHQGLVVVDHSAGFYPDGQVRDEDYEFAPFLGSRMATNGVTCVDCHNPHSAKPILPGNWLCLRCHDGTRTNAPVINPVEHAHHKVFGYGPGGERTDFDLMAYSPRAIKETGGECVNCHMPTTRFMQRHPRHDHGLTIPDPLLTKEQGIPNACTRCHSDKDAEWALAACVKWYGAKMDRPTRRRAQWIAHARANDSAARLPLVQMLLGPENPYWQAVGAGLLAPWIADTTVSNALLKSLEHPHPLVRDCAARALEPLVEQPGSAVTRALRRLLDDPVRSVRVSAAWALRGSLEADVAPARELRHYMDLNADQPTGQMQLAAFELARGRPQEAIAHYEKAILWDPNAAAIHHDVAVVLSQVGRNSEAIEHLKTACRLEPKEAEFQFKLGLAWNEAGRMDQTTAALEAAIHLDPRHSAAWYNLGLARNQLGQPEAALDALTRAASIEPNDARIPYAQATILAQLGRSAEAVAAARRALAVQPDFPAAQDLLKQLR